MQLTEEQLKKFNHDGFLIIKNFAPKELCDKILEKAKKHLEKKQAPIESEQEYMNLNENKITVRRLRQVFNREEIFKEWMTYKEIRPMLKQVLGDTPVLTLAHHNSIMTKMPFESTRTFWHQDRRYWNFENDNLVSVWLALGDEYLENGLLEFIPKTHKMNFPKDRFDEASNFLDEHEENKKLIEKRVHQNLEKGDIVLFHCQTLHHASKNKTEKPKISFVYTVKAQNNKPIKGTRSDFEEIVLD
ncbi:phytanoyl-CoA dioxygenase family protein [Halarcobacter ebronensis]|uniref:Phytanoyl-CoA dioxygenase n=1 Tax=Halarcobacter ebronensis TaxID=1462615 RepID=A0A4Q1AI64_9BACT|nr:phytanoyl-CoA dioxygenase family protein [Halarcobacter ebronensis]QKF83051.1 PhyH family dioxygenase [Halarcobacter ebronensis]RXK02428.1 phytanoyl-CoA dioxygenase [Halarcobacter ebronensis]